MYRDYVEILTANASQLFQDHGTVRVRFEPAGAGVCYALSLKIPFRHVRTGTEGFFALGFPDEAAAQQAVDVVSPLLGLSPDEIQSVDRLDVLSEFMNIVMGRAIEDWRQKGLEVEFDPPRTQKHAWIDQSIGPKGATWSVTLETGDREVVFLISFESAGKTA